MCSQFWSLKAHDQGTFLISHWLRLHTEGVGLTHGQGAEIQHAYGPKKAKHETEAML